MLGKKILKISLIEIFLIFSYLICWGSISTSLNDFLNFINITYLNFNNIFNFLRQFLMIMIFPILIIIFINNFKKLSLKNELIFVSALAYFLLQIPGLILTGNSIINIGYIISSLNILLIFILANIYFDKKRYYIFFYISLIMLFFMIILNYKIILNFFTAESSQILYLYHNNIEAFFGKQSPRSTGSSRTFLLIMIITFLIFNQFLKKNYFIKYVIYTLVAIFILLFQSRTTITLLIVFIFMNYIYEQDFSLKKFIKYLITYFIVPIILLYSILIMKQFNHDKNLLNLDNKTNNVSKNLSDVTKNFKRPIDTQSFSSGRIEDWKSILLKMDKSIIFGYGAQADRFLINQSASNGLIYAFSSSGFLGLLFFLFFSIYSFFIIFNNFLFIIRSKQIEFFYCSIVALSILLRSLLESSYALFSVDFIVIYTFINYLKTYKKN